MAKDRVRTIGLILWCDNEKHIQILEDIKTNYENYIYVLHDKDFDENGVVKKSHYHCILYFANARNVKSLQKKLGLEENCFYYIKSLKGQLRYLIHFDDDDKFQYHRDEVKGTAYMLSQFRKALKITSDEDTDFATIYDFIIRYQITDLNMLIDYVLENNLYSCFRRSYSIIKDIMHNIASEKLERRKKECILKK